MQQLVFGNSGTLAACTSLTQTTLNHARSSVAWLRELETHPSVLAATYAAVRLAAEQVYPNANMDDVLLPGVVASPASTMLPSKATQESALGVGITPLYVATDGSVYIARAITTKSLNGSTPDYRVLDVAQVTVSDYVRETLNLVWTTEVKPNNPVIRDNPDTDEDLPPPGVITPDRWNAVAIRELKALERGDGFVAPVVSDVDDNLPVSTYDSVAKRIMSAVNVVPAAQHHSIGVSVRQVA